MVARRRPPGRSTLRSMRSLRTASSSTMRSLTSSRPWWSASSTARASSTSRWSSVRSPHGTSNTVSSQVRIQPCSAASSGVRSSRLISRSMASRTDSGRVVAQRLEPFAEALDGVGLVVLAQLLADGGELLAQQELALALLHAVADLGADALGQLQLAQRLLGPAQHQLDARDRPRWSRAAGPCARCDRSGHQPAASARADGSSSPLSISLRRRPPRCSNRARKVARSSVAAARTVASGSGSVTGLGLQPEGVGGADDAGARPVARWSARTTSALVPDGSAPLDSIWATTPDAGVGAVDAGHEQEAPTVGRGLVARPWPRRSRGRW